ncbi:MAG: hypothetical protein JO317_00500 [Verrucomicrobiae bacterium]|nr:hypothetical protein [Verrucomicrobiae bacterium]
MLPINLFHELAKEEFDRKFDPVRIALLVFALGLLVMLGWTGLLYMTYKPQRESVATLQKELDRSAVKKKDADSKLAELPKVEDEFKLVKTRAEQKGLRSKVLETFKNSIPTNLYVRKLSITRKVEVTQKITGQDRKGKDIVVTTVTNFTQLAFEGGFVQPTKPKALEERDRLVTYFRTNQALAAIARPAPAPRTNDNAVEMSSFSTTEPKGDEPADASIGFLIQLKK